ncbi:MAG: hypothetical protein KGL26_09405, partial [Pseudomonadota bacterium]|nr:hypothetical protein [Pseudomonadota bacterium]
GGVEFTPSLSGPIWAGLGFFGAVVSTLIGMRMKPAGQAKFDWRIAGTWFASCCFISAMFAIFAPVSGLQVGAIIPLLIAWAYVVMGFWLGARYLVAGLVVTAVTLGGYFWWPEHFAGLMAVVGGGTLILTGLWLRKA